MFRLKLAAAAIILTLGIASPIWSQGMGGGMGRQSAPFVRDIQACGRNRIAVPDDHEGPHHALCLCRRGSGGCGGEHRLLDGNPLGKP